MEISFSPLTQINDVLLPADAERLSADELQYTMACDVRFSALDTVIVLDQTPLLGLVAQLIEACEQLIAGASAACVSDFYGEYELQYTRGRSLLEDRFSRQAVQVGVDELCCAVAEFARQAFDAVSAAWPSIEANSAFRVLRSLYGGQSIRR